MPIYLAPVLTIYFCSYNSYRLEKVATICLVPSDGSLPSRLFVRVLLRAFITVSISAHSADILFLIGETCTIDGSVFPSYWYTYTGGPPSIGVFPAINPFFCCIALYYFKTNNIQVSKGKLGRVSKYIRIDNQIGSNHIVNNISFATLWASSFM